MITPKYAVGAIPNTDCYLVIDFEATCCDIGSVPMLEMEIIEFAAVLVEETHGQFIASFDQFVRPCRHPVLTPYCTKLTSISQREVDAAAPLPEVVSDFRKWLALHSSEGLTAWASWGNYDLKQLQQDCAWHGLELPIDASHVNMKAEFKRRHRLPKQPSLDTALRLAGIVFEGRPHRGIDDARNAARLLPYTLGRLELPVLAHGSCGPWFGGKRESCAQFSLRHHRTETFIINL